MQKDEWETHVVYDQVEQVVRIYSTVPKHIRKLRSDDRFRVDNDAGDVIAGEINAADFNVLGGFKRKSKPMSEEQRAAAVARLAAARNRSKTHCPKNHEYTKENTRYADGRRYCRKCGTIKQAAYMARKKGV